MNLPRLSKPDLEGQMAVSKALKFQVLLDGDEMKDLLAALMPLHIFITSSVVKREEAEISKAQFLEVYTHYVDSLKKGVIPNEKSTRIFFSSLFTSSLDTLYAQEVRDDGYLIRPIKPVIQLQAHHFFYSELDKKFHSMVLSDQSVTWGIQFSYPQIFQDPKTTQFFKVINSPEFPSTALFLQLKQWLKKHSVPTPFLHGEIKTFVPLRIGKKCLSWIHAHPQLSIKGIEVAL